MISLELAKQHLRIAGADENSLIQLYIDAASSAFESWTGRKLVAAPTALPVPIGNAMRPTPAVQQGALLLVGHWYANREAVVVGVSGADIPMSTMALWSPYRWHKL